jgi:hypothetical protein
MRRWAILLITLCLLISRPTSAQLLQGVIGSSAAVSPTVANSYWVSKSGNDANACTLSTTPLAATAKLTINGGITCLSAGKTLYVRAGTYDEGISSVPNGTSWSNKVRIAAYPGDTVWMTPSSDVTSAGGIGQVIWLDGVFHYVEFDGINLDASNIDGGVMWISTNNGNDPHHIRLQNAEVIGCACGGGGSILLGAHTLIGATGGDEILNNTIHGGGLAGLCGLACAEYGVYVAGPNMLVEGNNIYNPSGAGVHIYNGAGDPADNNITRNNRIHDISRTGSTTQVWGIIVFGGNNNQVYNNIIYSITAGISNANNSAIYILGGSNKVWNNTAYNNTNTGINIDSGSTNTQIINNIAYLSTGADYIPGGTSTVSSNLFGTNPLFVNAGSANFQLNAGSPGVNTGTTVATVTSDIVGTPRPQCSVYDIGAYERNACP